MSVVGVFGVLGVRGMVQDSELWFGELGGVWR